MSGTTQIHGIYIDAPAEEVWKALTTSEHTRYGYGTTIDCDLRVGGSYRHLTTDAMKAMGMGDVAIEATIVELDPPRRLVLDWKAAWHDEPASRLTYDIQQSPSGLTRLTLTHELPDSPATAADVAGSGDVENGGGGWPWELASLKTLLETGRPMTTAGA
ncbi:SRPBCC domain-containing protein [Cellulomonas bogoriensis]|uniref:Transcriptional regulator n=1 Tax=Cellulomonas bogoriensis 69B4 = DSM 16987 TaxID=1386082 RepID=A0A0A0BMS2_9CELL|nr:SRPBCC domain-containing protein [Cellulomonas bogoriensis]KGM09226.1 transcriptional regulator [Cellulomonas bogoriensis 69B4 = DSM 16987]